MASLLSYALTTKADVKESLGISSGDTTKDNLIIRKINQATRVIENYCDTHFLNDQTYTEYYDAKNYSSELVLRNRPVVTFTGLYARMTTTNDNHFQTIDTNLYFVDNSAGVVKFLDNFWGSWQQWKVVYTAGYSTIPEDVAEACATLASYYVLNPASGAKVTHEKEGQREIHYQQMSTNNLIKDLGLDSVLDGYSQVYVSGMR